MALEEAATSKFVSPWFHYGVFINSGSQVEFSSETTMVTSTPLSSTTVKIKGRKVEGSLTISKLPIGSESFVSDFAPEI